MLFLYHRPINSEYNFYFIYFGLSILGYHRNMAVQHGSLSEMRPAPHVDILYSERLI